MSNTPSRAILDVIQIGGARIFTIELEIDGGGLIKVWQSSDYLEAASALRKIADAAGVPSRDDYSRGSACVMRS